MTAWDPAPEMFPDGGLKRCSNASECPIESSGKRISTVLEKNDIPTLAPDRLRNHFDIWWPRLQEKLKAIPAGAPAEMTAAKRSESEILNEILQIVRHQPERNFESTARLEYEMELHGGQTTSESKEKVRLQDPRWVRAIEEARVFCADAGSINAHNLQQILTNHAITRTSSNVSDLAKYVKVGFGGT